jgi:PAS domain S-box-containing protein
LNVALHAAPSGHRPLSGGRDPAREPLPVALAAFAVGAILALGAARAPSWEFLAGWTIMAPLFVAVLLLSRLADRSNERLLAGEASYRAFFEHAVEGIFRTTPDGHYLDVNQALAEIYGYDGPRALMRGLTNIAAQLYVDPDRRDEFRRQLQTHDVVTDFVSEIRRRDGSKIWISENARAVRDWSGRLVCYEGTVENVTAKIEGERAMRRALKEAEQASRAKNAFLAAMSHELKTPLNAVIGFSEIIKNEMFGPMGVDAYHAYAEDIHASGKKLLAIINDVLDVSRLEAGAITVEAEVCEIAQLVNGAVALARTATGDARAINIDIPAVMPDVSVDARRIRQALGNIISNALKFTPEGGQVAICARCEKNGAVVFAVADTGIGMAKEKIALALEPFRQLDGSLARRFEGAGLGLSIARALVELHGGALEIESAVNTGTTVTITLPPARTCRGAQAQQAS